MGVYINGFPLPNNCGACPLRLAWCRERIYMVNRPDRCPLVPVPPHGRLIDADEMADVFRGFIAMYDSCPFSQLATTDKARRDELQAALAEVINAPTIIPAEEE